MLRLFHRSVAKRRPVTEFSLDDRRLVDTPIDAEQDEYPPEFLPSRFLVNAIVVDQLVVAARTSVSTAEDRLLPPVHADVSTGSSTSRHPARSLVAQISSADASHHFQSHRHRHRTGRPTIRPHLVLLCQRRSTERTFTDDGDSPRPPISVHHREVLSSLPLNGNTRGTVAKLVFFYQREFSHKTNKMRQTTFAMFLLLSSQLPFSSSSLCSPPDSNADEMGN